MAAKRGGCDALVFTGGVGENASAVREAAISGLLRLDPERNAAAEGDANVSAAASAARMLVIAAREERVAAEFSRGLLGRARPRPVGARGEAPPRSTAIRPKAQRSCRTRPRTSHGNRRGQWSPAPPVVAVTVRPRAAVRDGTPRPGPTAFPVGSGSSGRRHTSRRSATPGSGRGRVPARPGCCCSHRRAGSSCS